MKRIFKAVCVVLSCVLCLCFIGGCNNSPVVTTYEDAVQALKNAGYENAYRGDYEGRGAYIYLGTEGDIQLRINHRFNNDTLNEGYMAHSDYYNYVGFLHSGTDVESCKYDYAKILDTVMPMLDREYRENALDIINQSLEYQKNHVYEVEYSDGGYITKLIEFKKSKYTVSYYIIDSDPADGSADIGFEVYEN